MFLRFFMYGLMGLAVEVVWTAIYDKIFIGKPGWKLQGTTSIWMLPIYGLTVFLYEPIHNIIRDVDWYYRGLIYTSGIMLVEYGVGYALKTLDMCPWDYSNLTKLNFNGLVRIDYIPVWFIVGMALEPIHDLMIEITPMIYSVF